MTKAKKEDEEETSPASSLRIEALLKGTCPTCFKAVIIRRHKKHGYHMRCNGCRTVIFTGSPEGSINFRIQQELLLDPSVQEVWGGLMRPLLPEFERKILPQEAFHDVM